MALAASAATTCVVLERGLLERGVHVVGVNDLWDAATLAHLLQNDTTFGRLRWDVDHDDANIRVGGASIPTYREKDPAVLPWAEVGIDLVIEATGRRRARDDAAAHLKAGARRVLITAPGKNADLTVVMGINEKPIDQIQHEILSAASCPHGLRSTGSINRHGVQSSSDLMKEGVRLADERDAQGLLKAVPGYRRPDPELAERGFQPGALRRAAHDADGDSGGEVEMTEAQQLPRTVVGAAMHR